jgi:hypothetical protein
VPPHRAEANSNHTTTMKTSEKNDNDVFAELKKLQVPYNVKVNEALTRGGIGMQHIVTGNLSLRHYTCKEGQAQWKPYTCALEGTVLYCFPDEGHMAGKSWQKTKQILPVIAVTASLNLDAADPVNDREDAEAATLTDFVVACANNLICFRCEDSEDATVWIDKLTKNLCEVRRRVAHMLTEAVCWLKARILLFVCTIVHRGV